MTVMAGHLGFASFAPVFLLTVFGSLGGRRRRGAYALRTADEPACTTCRSR
jgi:CPA1 family monovalent cation:H+ antiporter